VPTYPGQIALPLRLRPQARFDDFVPGPNALAVAALRRAVELHNEPYLLLFGPPGTGKSHLLHAACQAAIARGDTAVYIPLSEPELSPPVLADLEQIRLIALDDIDRICGDVAWEQGVFNLYNRLREKARSLLISADRPAAELPLRLADLRSRLTWGPAFRLQPLSDPDCETLLRRAALARGLELGEASISYIMRRSVRDTRSLLAIIDALDEASLREKRRPTIPMIRELLDRSNGELE